MSNKIILSILLCFVFYIIQAQQNIKQPGLHASYQIPVGDWKVQEYNKGNWDKPSGSSICPCALSFNVLKIANGADYDYLNMVVYPDTKKTAKNPKHNQLWQYTISTADKADSIHTAHLQWEEYSAKLTCTGENRFKDYTALKFQSHTSENYFTILFWAKPAIIEQYKSSILQIIESFNEEIE